MAGMCTRKWGHIAWDGVTELGWIPSIYSTYITKERVTSLAILTKFRLQPAERVANWCRIPDAIQISQTPIPN